MVTVSKGDIISQHNIGKLRYNRHRMRHRIKQLRKARKWTQAHMADKIGVHLSHISKFEQGLIKPSLDMLMKLAALFEVSTDYLLFGDEAGFEERAFVSRLRMLDEKERQVAFDILDGWIMKKGLKAEDEGND